MLAKSQSPSSPSTLSRRHFDHACRAAEYGCWRSYSFTLCTATASTKVETLWKNPGICAEPNTQRMSSLTPSYQMKPCCHHSDRFTSISRYASLRSSAHRAIRSNTIADALTPIACATERTCATASARVCGAGNFVSAQSSRTMPPLRDWMPPVATSMESSVVTRHFTTERSSSMTSFHCCRATTFLGTRRAGTVTRSRLPCRIQPRSVSLRTDSRAGL